MKRQAFWVLVTMLLSSVHDSAYCSPNVNPGGVEKIETANAILTLKNESGDLVGVQWKRPKLDIIGEPKLGENFRILLPLPDCEANYFNSRDQVVRKVDRSNDRVVLHYGPLRNERGEVNVNVAYEIRDTGTQLQFSIEVDNGTERKLAEVYYGILGGQRGIGERTATESLVPGSYHSNLAAKLFSQFEMRGMPFGVPFNFAGYSYPGDMAMGWMDVYNSQAGIGYYYANQDPETRVTALYTEMHPYTKSLSPQDNWPRPTELPAGEPVGLTMGWVNFPYAAQGLFRAGPVVLQVHAGDWHTAAKLYRGWFDRHFQVAHPLSWLRREMAWQSINILSPEDKVLFQFKDLPKLAADATRYGITTFQIFAWPVGGQDRGRPNYVPDPRLGTLDEFRKALADIRALGVHPILYANVQMADTSSEAFRDRLSRYTVQGRWAPDLTTWHWGQSTIGGRLMHATGRHLTLISPSHAAFREEILGQYLNRIEDGAEGFQMDGGSPAGILDFNPNLSTSPDKSLPQGMQTAMEELLRRARTINPQVALSLQDSFDRSFPYNDVTYGAPLTQDAMMAVRYTFPEWTMVAMAEKPEDFGLMNNALRYGFGWGLAPRFHTASVDEPLTRPLSRYVSELIRIRKQYVDLLFFGRFNDTEGATVTGDQDNIRYSVFAPMNGDAPERAVVIVNFGNRPERVRVDIPGRAGRRVAISAPFEPDRVAEIPATVRLPANRAAVVVMKGQE